MVLYLFILYESIRTLGYNGGQLCRTVEDLRQGPWPCWTYGSGGGLGYKVDVEVGGRERGGLGLWRKRGWGRRVNGKTICYINFL